MESNFVDCCWMDLLVEILLLWLDLEQIFAHSLSCVYFSGKIVTSIKLRRWIKQIYDILIYSFSESVRKLPLQPLLSWWPSILWQVWSQRKWIDFETVTILFDLKDFSGDNLWQILELSLRPGNTYQWQSPHQLLQVLWVLSWPLIVTDKSLHGLSTFWTQ